MPFPERETNPFAKRIPYDEFSGRYAAFDRFANVRLREFTIIAIYDNYIAGRWGEEYNRTYYIAKPYLLRRESYDGLTIGGVTYTYQDVGERLAEDAVGSEDDETQIITPDYYVGEKLLCGSFYHADLKFGNSPIEWIDINVGGRCWAVEQ